MKQTHAPNVIPATDLSGPDAARYALLQDMVANHDWSMRAGPAGKECCHNAELIGPLGPGSTVPIPYDFDFSGFVDAPYATPPDELHLASVRQRVYRGYCLHNNDVLAAARQMREARPQLMAAITSTPGMQPDDGEQGDMHSSMASLPTSRATMSSIRSSYGAASVDLPSSTTTIVSLTR